MLDPVFQPSDSSSHKKGTVNEIPQELKFTLVFDEKSESSALQKLMNIGNGMIKEEIESDEEDELALEEAMVNQE